MTKRYIDAPEAGQVYTVYYVSRIPYAKRPTRTLYMDMLTPFLSEKPPERHGSFDRSGSR